ncbi:hypothetical protein AALB19_17715 [Oscillospiraceae bacterium 50-58]
MEIREMLDLNPSFAEVQAAKAVFLERLKHYAPAASLPEGDPGYMSKDTLLSCALAEVWRQGRWYQRDQDSGKLMELAGMGAAV